MSAGYVIHVGHHSPKEVIIAHPTKDGMPGVNVATQMRTVGTYNLINRARVWGRRVMDNGKLAKEGETVEVTTKDYHGRIEFLEHGKPEVGAQMLDIRYLSQSSSLDVDYQDNVQKIKLDPAGKDNSGFIELASGENKFDPKTQSLLIQYLKVHPQNKNSKSKNPDPQIKGYMFMEVESNTDTTSIKQDEASITAGSFVMGLSEKIPSLRNLMSILLEGSADFGETNLLSGDLDVYKALLIYARSKPGDFAYIINEFKKKVSDNFEKAKAAKALDLTKAGEISLLVNSKKDILLEEIPAKEEGMLTWVLDNYLDGKVYERIKHLDTVCSKLIA